MKNLNLKHQAIITTLVICFAVSLFTGLAVIPAMEQAHATNLVSESKNKGKQGERASEGKRSGQDRGGDI